MNRQIRREQKKAEEKQNKERDRLKFARQMRRQRFMTRRSQPKAKSARPGLEKTKIGRFSGTFVWVALAIIILQSFLPPGDPQQTQQWAFLIQVAYYLLFGYFAYLWLERQQRQQSFYLAIGAGVAVVALLTLVLVLVPNFDPDWRVVGLSIPMVALGAFLARWVYSKAV